MNRFIAWLSKQSTARLIGLLVGDTRHNEGIIASQRAEIERLNELLARWQNKWLERQGFAPVNAAPPSLTESKVTDPADDDEELRRKDEEAEIVERAELAASSEEEFEYAQAMAGADPRWIRVVEMAEEMMEPAH